MSLRDFRKNIEFLPEETHLVYKDNVMMNVLFLQDVHRKVGVQMQVAKEVSDDLLNTDFTGTIEPSEVPFPAESIEVYFEDPELPSCVLSHINIARVRKLLPNTKIVGDPEECYAILTQCKRGNETPTPSAHKPVGSFFIFIAPDKQHWNEFVTSAIMHIQQDSEAFSQEENDSLRELTVLALKVLIFATTPVCKTTPIGRKQMHHGGKPEVNGRPKTPSNTIQYMPKVVRVAAPNSSGERHEFRGRCGVIRWYRHERFVNRRGSWDYIAPIKDPVTGQYPKQKTIKVIKT